jgi:hypothetical protein
MSEKDCQARTSLEYPRSHRTDGEQDDLFSDVGCKRKVESHLRHSPAHQLE